MYGFCKGIDGIGKLRHDNWGKTNTDLSIKDLVNKGWLNKVFGERKLIESLSLEGLSIGIGRLKGPPVGLTLTTPPIECQFLILFILFISVKG